MDQPKIERMLRLLKLLTANNRYTISDLANRLQTSDRTIYRYIDSFREAGFVIKKQGDITRIDKSSPYFKDISQLVHFTEEEAYILKSAIENIDENNLLKQNLKRKLYSVYNYKILAETVVKGKNAENVNHLIDAMENEQQVVLENYSSANSKNVRNRIVEPFGFTTNYIQIWAYEPSSSENKLFKLSRIENVKISNTVWQNKDKHRKGYIDLFRISSFKQYPVKLKMGLRAATLLIEEYPLSERELIRITDNEWILQTNVCSFEGVGRFVTGLLEDIQIIDSPEFECFIRNKLKKYNI